MASITSKDKDSKKASENDTSFSIGSLFKKKNKHKHKHSNMGSSSNMVQDDYNEDDYIKRKAQELYDLEIAKAMDDSFASYASNVDSQIFTSKVSKASNASNASNNILQINDEFIDDDESYMKMIMNQINEQEIKQAIIENKKHLLQVKDKDVSQDIIESLEIQEMLASNFISYDSRNNNESTNTKYHRLDSEIINNTRNSESSDSESSDSDTSDRETNNLRENGSDDDSWDSSSDSDSD